MVPNTNTTELGDLYTNTLNVDVIQGNNGFTSLVATGGVDTGNKKITLKTKLPYSTGSEASMNARSLQFTYCHTAAAATAFSNANNPDAVDPFTVGMNYETDEAFSVTEIDTTQKILTFTTLPTMKNKDGDQVNIPDGSRLIIKGDELVLNGKVRIVGDQHSSLSEQSQLTINGVMQVGDGDETDSLFVNAGKAKFVLHDNGLLNGTAGGGADENNGEFYCDADGLITLKSTLNDAAAAIKINASAGGMDIDVKQNRTLDVEGNNTDTITGIHSLESKSTDADGAIKINASAGGMNIDVKQNRTLDVEGNNTDTITGTSTHTVTGKYSLSSDYSGIDAIKLNASNTAGGIDIDAGTGGIDIDTTGDFSIDAADAKSINIGTSAEATHDDAAINIGTTGNRTIKIGNDAVGSNGKIHLLSDVVFKGNLNMEGTQNGDITFNTSTGTNKKFLVQSKQTVIETLLGNDTSNNGKIQIIGSLGNDGDTPYTTPDESLWTVEVRKDTLILWNNQTKVTTFKPRV